MMKFSANMEKLDTIDAIGTRADTYECCVVHKERLKSDLIACHLNSCKLNLQLLLAMDDESFFHDVLGISSMIDRNTGKLTGNFWPRSALEERK